MNKNKGITLIALVITIIVLIILAGVSINLILGQYGIVNRATSGAETYSEKQAKEKLELELSNMYIEKNTNINYNEDDYLTTKLSEKGFSVNGNIVIVDGYQFQIDRTVPKIMNSLGKGIENNEIILTANSNLEADYTKSTIKIEITYAGELKEINLNGESLTIPEAQDGKYVIEKEVEKNGNYNVFVKDSSDGYKIANVEVKNISEDTNIGTVEQFIAFRDRVNAGATYEGRTVRLTKNLDLSSVCGADKGSWIPIGTEEHPFKGTFDGKHNSIYNLYISNTLDYSGLFGYANNATIKGIIIKSGKHESSGQRGGNIIGNANHVELSECGNYLPITTSLYNGGLIGQAIDSIIDKCFNAGEIIATTSDYVGIGGIVGSVDGNIDIYNCYNTGKLTSNGLRAGGIIGSFWNGDSVSNRNIYNCYNIGEINVNGNIGGITGNANSRMIISNCVYITPDKYYGDQNYGWPTLENTQRVTKEELKTYAATLGDAYVNDDTNINNGYPILKWQIGK